MNDSKMSVSSSQQPKTRSYEIITKYFDQYFFKTDNFSLIKLMMYTPIGITLVIIRLSILLLLITLLNLFPKIKTNGYFIRAISWNFGIFTKSEELNENSDSNQDNVRIYVSNHITCLDYLAIKSIITNSNYLEDNLMNRNLTTKHASNNSLSSYLQKVLQCDRPKETENDLYTNRSKFPFIFFPELIATNGNYGVLKFDTKPFDLNQDKIKVNVVPVGLQAYRPLVALSVNWLGSNDLINMFFMLFTPITIYKIKFFPEKTLQETETSELFANRIQKTISNGLNLTCSNLDRENIRQIYIDYEKNLQEQQDQLEQRQNQAEQHQNNLNRDIQFNDISRVAIQVKNVLPYISYDTVREHVMLTSSNDVDTIITSILDSGVNLDNSQANTQITPTKSTSNSANQSPKTPNNFKKSPGIFQSYETRKFNLLSEARERFLSKNPNIV